MNYNEAIAKASKLLRLSQSDNPNEAALAASRAQEIIDRYKLNLDNLAMDGAVSEASNAPEPIQDFSRDPLTPHDAQLQRWKGQLAMGIAQVNQCKVWRNGGRLNLVGGASDVQACRYLFAWLTNEVERLANRACAGCGRTYWNNYRLGAVESIVHRLREQQKATIATVKTEAATTGTYALAIVQRNELALVARAKEVDAWTKKNLKLRSDGGGGRTRYDSDARQAGREAGNRVSLTASGRLGHTQARIA